MPSNPMSKNLVQFFLEIPPPANIFIFLFFMDANFLKLFNPNSAFLFPPDVRTQSNPISDNSIKLFSKF